MIHHAGKDVSDSDFVLACITFQQAKKALLEHLGPGATVLNCEAVSAPVYDLANKALDRKDQLDRAHHLREVQTGKKPTLRDVILKVLQGKKSFTIREVVETLQKRGLCPSTGDLYASVATTLNVNKTVFKRVGRGTYKLKTPRTISLTLSKPKALPAATSEV